MNKKVSKAPPPIVFILLAALGIFSWSKLPSLGFQNNTNIINKLPLVVDRSALRKNFSLGERMLIKANPTAAKQHGVLAYGKQNYAQAANYFQQSLVEYPRYNAN